MKSLTATGSFGPRCLYALALPLVDAANPSSLGGFEFGRIVVFDSPSLPASRWPFGGPAG